MKIKFLKKINLRFFRPSRIFAKARKAILLGFGLPLGVFLIVMLFSFIGFVAAGSSVDELSLKIINRRVEEYALTVSQSVKEYKLLHIGNTARIESSITDQISEQSWQQYIDIYNLQNSFPSLEFIAISFGDSPRDNILYFAAPDDAKTKTLIGSSINSLGLSEQAFAKAAETDQPVVASGLANELFVLSAFYDSEEKANQSGLRGFNITRIDQQKFLGSIFRQERLIQSKIQVFFASKKDGNLLYRSDNRENKDATVIFKEQQLPFFDKQLNVVYEFDKARILPWYSTYFPSLILAAGVLLGLVLTMLVSRLTSRRNTAIKIQKEKDIALAQNELLSLASHQLRTPATGVKQYLGMVLQGFAGNITQKQRTYLERAYASNDRQLSVINDILHVAKLSSGRIVLTERSFDITKLIREIVDDHRPEIKKAGLSVSISLPSRGNIFADSHMLRMVFENLLSNALKYTHTGGIVKISAINRHDHWYVTIADTGVGIAKEDIPKLFQQFSRIKNPLSDRVPGTGVGLYLAYHLTKLHGGWIRVTSRPQEGSSFTVCIPRSDQKKEKV
jgi:signal transduction histidine kinase